MSPHPLGGGPNNDGEGWGGHPSMAWSAPTDGGKGKI